MRGSVATRTCTCQCKCAARHAQACNCAISMRTGHAAPRFLSSNEAAFVAHQCGCSLSTSEVITSVLGELTLMPCRGTDQLEIAVAAMCLKMCSAHVNERALHRVGHRTRHGSGVDEGTHGLCCAHCWRALRLARTVTVRVRASWQRRQRNCRFGGRWWFARRRGGRQRCVSQAQVFNDDECRDARHQQRRRNCTPRQE